MVALVNSSVQSMTFYGKELSRNRIAYRPMRGLVE